MDRRLPSFLVIGAQKSGTTTLYRDLLSNPGIAFAPRKEAGNLAHDSVNTPEGRAEYGSLYDHARPDQLCGDASTEYSKLPHVEGVAGRAMAVLGSETRIIYIVRNPIERIISHHYHEHRFGRASASIDTEVRSDHKYLAYSRYAYQSVPWVETFGADRFLAIDFHEYVSSRGPSLERVLTFLDVGFDEGVDPNGVFNAGEEARVISTSFWTSVRQSSVYRRVRPRIPPEVREQLRKLVLPSPPPRPAPPSPDTLEYLISELADDIQEQPDSLGWRSVPWSVGALSERYLGTGRSE